MKYVINLCPKSDQPGAETEITICEEQAGCSNPIAPENLTIRRNDILEVIVDYGDCIDNGVPVPLSAYKNLSLGASIPADGSGVLSLLHDEPNFTSVMWKITHSNDTQDIDFFDCKVETPMTISRGGQNNSNFVQKVTMRFNPGEIATRHIQEAGDKMVLVFTYGDPHSDEIPLNVGKD